jgi:hypothetical protein
MTAGIMKSIQARLSGKTMANKKSWQGIALALTLVLVLAGCSSKDSGPSNETSSPRATSAYDFTFEVRDGSITITGLYRSAREVVIPSKINGVSVTAIRNEAFKRKDLISATIPNGVSSIGDEAFAQNQLTGTGVNIPNSVTTIGNSAFAQNQLTKITIPNSVTSIGDRTFFSNQLTSVTIGNKVTSIGDSAFAQNQLTKISIPNSVTSIGNRAFSNNKLTSITIPNNVDSIGGGAFSENPLTSVTIPAKVTDIEYAPFILCQELTTINVAPNNSNYSSVDGVLYDKNVATLIQWPTGKTDLVTIPNSVSSIGNYAFSGNQLTSVTIPDSVTSIGDGAFNDNPLTTVTIGTNVTLGTGNTSFGNSGFDRTYNNGARVYGIYTRPNATSTTWTREWLNPPSNSDSLTVNEWTSGSITAASGSIWYSFSVNSGTAYRIWVDDSDTNGTDTTSDVMIMAFYGNGAQIWSNPQDQNWNYASSFTANRTDTVYVLVTPLRIGTYRLVYSNTGTRPR